MINRFNVDGKLVWILNSSRAKVLSLLSSFIPKTFLIKQVNAGTFSIQYAQMLLMKQVWLEHECILWSSTHQSIMLMESDIVQAVGCNLSPRTPMFKSRPVHVDLRWTSGTGQVFLRVLHCSPAVIIPKSLYSFTHPTLTIHKLKQMTASLNNTVIHEQERKWTPNGDLKYARVTVCKFHLRNDFTDFD